MAWAYVGKFMVCVLLMMIAAVAGYAAGEELSGRTVTSDPERAGILGALFGAGAATTLAVWIIF